MYCSLAFSGSCPYVLSSHSPCLYRGRLLFSNVHLPLAFGMCTANFVFAVLSHPISRSSSVQFLISDFVFALMPPFLFSIQPCDIHYLL